VLRSIRHGESSRIVTLFTRNHGKVAVIAKGARKSKSNPIGSGVETMNLIEALIYFKATRSVQTLGQTSALYSFPSIKGDIVATGYASAALEMINLCFTDSDVQPDAFDFVCETLKAFEKGDLDYRINLWLFQLYLFKLIGFELDPFRCPVCGKDTADIALRNQFILSEGCICCAQCHSGGEDCLPLTGESVSLLRRLSKGRDKTLNRLKPSPNARKEISVALEKYLRRHNPDIRKTPALKMLSSFENLPAMPHKSAVQPKTQPSKE